MPCGNGRREGRKKAGREDDGLEMRCRRRAGLSGLFLLLALGGCSFAPDWADPGHIFDDDAPPESRSLDPDAPIPNLASVPSRPRSLSSRESRDEARDALSLDLENATIIRGDDLPGGETASDGKARGGNEAALPSSEIVAVIYFNQGAATLGAGERDILAEVAKLQQEQGTRLTVIGHSSRGGVVGDPETARAANLRVSEKRAEAIVRALIDLGVEADDLLYSGVGDREPLYEETASSGAAGNRRAEIFLETRTQAQ